MQIMKLFTNWPVTQSIHMNINQSKKGNKNKIDIYKSTKLL